MYNYLRGKKILVTGGAGFIGSHIVDKLVSAGANVVVLDNLSFGTLDNIKSCIDKIEFIKGDIRDENTLGEALQGVELVSHQAALRSVPKSVGAPFEYHDVNVNGTLRLYIKAKELGIKRVVFASSSSVYGERDKFPEKETDYPHPISPYAASKLICEQYAYVFTKSYGVDVVSLRYFNVFGPRQSLENKYAVVVPKFITSLLKDETPPIYGNGEQSRDFTYIDDVVEANLSALVKEGAGGEVFNIAGGEPHSVNELLYLLKQIIGKDIEPEYLDPRPGDVYKTHACVSKAKKLLGWQQKIDFYEGLKRTAEWFKRQIANSG
ncbi:MAG: LPS biosynthesis protein WbpP [Candidatus Omnitrophica bacterium 4484_171]|nr:MAG: LPS biosynthesis protein WbpP [Candidatus Omnitrophica bacterium 4484_171]